MKHCWQCHGSVPEKRKESICRKCIRDNGHYLCHKCFVKVPVEYSEDGSVLRFVFRPIYVDRYHTHCQKCDKACDEDYCGDCDW